MYLTTQDDAGATRELLVLTGEEAQQRLGRMVPYESFLLVLDGESIFALVEMTDDERRDLIEKLLAAGSTQTS